MGMANARTFTPVDEYLQGELETEIRHEYVNGTVYAMGGASRNHNIVTMNLGTALHAALRGGPCQTFMADMKVHLRLGDDELFYYPDVMVGCDPDDRHRYYLERPRVIAEVASPATERVDRREKLLAYTRLDSLATYLIVEQQRPAVQVYRRSAGWAAEHLGAEDRLELPELEWSLPVEELYTGIDPDAVAEDPAPPYR